MSVFVNWSNHPFNSWDAQQLEAAKAFGELVYRPFSDVSPTCSAAEIISLAELQVNDFSIQFPDKQNVVIMLQGEMTLLYHLLKLLEIQGYRVVAATSERDVIHTPDGKEIKSFRFAGFRDYFMHE